MQISSWHFSSQTHVTKKLQALSDIYAHLISLGFEEDPAFQLRNNPSNTREKNTQNIPNTKKET